MVPFESLDMVFYSPSIVTMAVYLTISQIFSIKECPDLEMWVWGRSKSLKMARFNRPCTTFYWSAIITIAVSCITLELFDVEYYRDLEMWVKGGHSSSLKIVPYESLGTVFGRPLGQAYAIGNPSVRPSVRPSVTLVDCGQTA